MVHIFFYIDWWVLFLLALALCLILCGLLPFTRFLVVFGTVAWMVSTIYSYCSRFMGKLISFCHYSHSCTHYDPNMATWKSKNINGIRFRNIVCWFIFMTVVNIVACTILRCDINIEIDAWTISFNILEVIVKDCNQESPNMYFDW